jgi:hypothetical protein
VPNSLSPAYLCRGCTCILGTGTQDHLSHALTQDQVIYTGHPERTACFPGHVEGSSTLQVQAVYHITHARADAQRHTQTHTTPSKSSSLRTITYYKLNLTNVCSCPSHCQATRSNFKKQGVVGEIKVHLLKSHSLLSFAMILYSSLVVPDMHALKFTHSPPLCAKSGAPPAMSQHVLARKACALCHSAVPMVTWINSCAWGQCAFKELQ